MNINALMAFRAIVAEGSVAAAAQRLNRSQPAVSRMIAVLEHELKLRLFHRTRRRLALSDEGRAFYKETERILSGLNEIPKIAADIRERRQSDLRLVAMPRAVFAWVNPAIEAFHRRNPDVRISVDVARHQDMENWLTGRHYDFGIGVLPAQHAAIETTEVFRAPLCAIVRKGDRLARRGQVTIADLVSQPLIGISAGLMPRDQVDQLFRGAGLKPVYGIETTSTYLAAGLVAAGAGLALFDNVSAAVEPARVVCVPLAPPQWVPFGLLRPRHARDDGTAKAFVQQLQDTARELVRTHGVRLSIVE